jgi:PAS domain S-box-containing protein
LQEAAHAFDQMASSLDLRESERREAEAGMRERESNLLLAQRVGRVGSWHHDFVRGSMQWSDELYRIFGVTPDAFTPTVSGSPHFVHPDDRQRGIDERARVLEKGGEFQVDYRTLLPDGRERVMSARALLQYDADGRPRGMIGTVQDITDREASKRALADSERKLRTMFDLAHDALVLIRTEADADTIVDCNAKALAVFGRSREELVGHAHALLLPESRADGTPSAAGFALHRALALSGEAQAFEWEFRRRDGTRVC